MILILSDSRAGKNTFVKSEMCSKHKIPLKNRKDKKGKYCSECHNKHVGWLPKK